MSDKTAEQIRNEIQEAKAKASNLQFDLARVEVIEKAAPEWLSSAGKYMVSASVLGAGIEFTVYRWSEVQSSGVIAAADIVSLRDYLNECVPAGESL